MHPLPGRKATAHRPETLEARAIHAIRGPRADDVAPPVRGTSADEVVRDDAAGSVRAARANHAARASRATGSTDARSADATLALGAIGPASYA